MDAYVSKPIDAQKLVSAIESVLGAATGDGHLDDTQCRTAV